MWHKTKTIALFTALEAARGRLLLLLAVTALAGFLIAAIAGAAAVTESTAIRAAFLAAFLRTAAVFITSLFVVSSVAREQADKGSELVLSLALPRYVYYFGKAAGYALVALVTALLFGALLALHAPPLQAVWWTLSLYCELVLVMAASLLCMFTFAQVTSALSAVAAFYLLARLIGAIQLIGHGPLIDPNDRAMTLIVSAVDGIAYFLPDLYRFTLTDWLLYDTGTAASLAPILLQTVIYLALLAGAGLFDLYRKNF
jgi:hypothetical protein